MGASKEKHWVYTDQSGLKKQDTREILVSDKDRQRIRELAKKWAEIAKSDVMRETKRQWKALNDLKAERPMIVFEPYSVTGFVTAEDVHCEQPLLKNIEQTMVYAIRQHDEFKDDVVLEDYFRLAWKVERPDYGVAITERRVEDSMAYLSDFPIKTTRDISLLKERTFTVDRGLTLKLKDVLENVFGDIIPIRLGNYDYFMPEIGLTPFCGLNFIGITMDLFKLIGYDNMLLWLYDEPASLHKLLRYLCDDRKRFYQWLQAEGLLDYNAEWQCSGPSSAAYASCLPQPEGAESVRAGMKDCWVWPESQETTPVSPVMFNEVFLPYIAEVANMFGLSYYGCCESVTDRIEHIKAALPNLRKVSVSGWNNFARVSEALGTEYVYSRKPKPTYISGRNPDWAGAEKDIKDTLSAVRSPNLEFIVRDVYDIGGDMNVIRKWISMTKKAIGM